MKRKNINKARRELYKAIKKEFKSTKDALGKRPLDYEIVGWGFLLTFFVVFVFEVLAIIKNQPWMIVTFCIGLVVLIILVIMSNRFTKKYFAFFKKRREDRNILSLLVLDDVSKKIGVTKEELTIYLLAKLDRPYVIKLITYLVSLFATIYAVISYPGFKQQNEMIQLEDIILLVVIVFANFITSFCADKLNKCINDLYNIEYYLVCPYEERFETIDEKLMKM